MTCSLSLHFYIELHLRVCDEDSIALIKSSKNSNAKIFNLASIIILLSSLLSLKTCQKVLVNELLNF